MTLPAPYSTDEQKWSALATRDSTADGKFLYAVRTTGVYCRPSCSSRLPRRSNVVYFESCAKAEQGGFRPCKKCRPAKDLGRVPESIIRACRMIEVSDTPPTLDELAGSVGLSPYYFHRLFKSAVGVTPKAYAAAHRAARFREGLKAKRTVTEAIYGAGFGSSSRLYDEAGDQLGMTPRAYRKGGTGQLIRFVVEKCSLGWVAVAVTTRGVCLIEFGNAREELRHEVAARFPAAEVQEGDSEFRAWIGSVLACVDGGGAPEGLPLDIRGTAFQRRVWAAIRAIPRGTTATYGQIAKKIRHPAAVRAVARACAANELAVVVPCHRVVGKDGGLSGYRWGLERKKRLLDRESAQQDATP